MSTMFRSYCRVFFGVCSGSASEGCFSVFGNHIPAPDVHFSFVNLLLPAGSLNSSWCAPKPNIKNVFQPGSMTEKDHLAMLY